MENYVALDLETTGLSPKNDRILEIGAVKIEEGRETGRIATLIDPQMKIPERITALTGMRLLENWLNFARDFLCLVIILSLISVL